MRAIYIKSFQNNRSRYVDYLPGIKIIMLITSFLNKTVVKHFNGHVLPLKGKAESVRCLMCQKISKPPTYTANPLGENTAYNR